MSVPKLPFPEFKMQSFEDHDLNHVTLGFDILKYASDVRDFFDLIDEAAMIVWMQTHGYTVSHEDPTRIHRLLEKLPQKEE